MTNQQYAKYMYTKMGRHQLRCNFTSHKTTIKPSETLMNKVNSTNTLGHQGDDFDPQYIGQIWTV